MLWGGNKRRLAVVLTAVVVAAAAAGCGGGGDKSKSDSKPSSSTSTSPSASGTADGVKLTAQGSKLQVGQTATVSFQPRQGQTGVMDITVTRLEKTTFDQSFQGWNVDPQQKTANPYFVRATVTNRGKLDLGGRPTPLYIVDGNNTLIEPTTFASDFTPCSPNTLPTSFPTGATANVCLVYLSPNQGQLTAVSFRPTEQDDPITWTGDLQQPKQPKPAKKGKHHKKKNQ